MEFFAATATTERQRILPADPERFDLVLFNREAAGGQTIFIHHARRGVADSDGGFPLLAQGTIAITYATGELWAVMSSGGSVSKNLRGFWTRKAR